MSVGQAGNHQNGNTNTVRPESVDDSSVAVVVEDQSLCDVEADNEARVRKPLKLHDPLLPKKDDVDEHYLTHLPFRSWCQHCAQGAGKAADHRQQDREDGLPDIHMDYCFLGTTGEPTETVLVLRQRPCRMTMSAIVPTKGASVEWAVRRCLAFI